MGTPPEAGASPNAHFLAGAVPHGAIERVRFGNSFIGSAFTHTAGFVLVLFVVDNFRMTPPSTRLQVRIVRSLDPTFGLDDEALRAVKNWRLRPGTRQGRNVAVIVEIELTFTLR
jgi:Gram-negative bacterial TonB protein C-terminal